MNEREIKMENVLLRQVQHVLENYEGMELSHKIYDLIFEWFLKGFNQGVQIHKEFQ